MPETEGFSAVTPTVGGRADTAGHYDVLVLDATHKQSLASARSLGRAGLRVALAESYAEHRRGEPVPAFSSKYCHYAVELPNYAQDAAAYRDAVIDFVQAHGTRVVLPTGDGNIAAIAPSRKRLADLGCVLALASDATLDIACDKDRTLEIARALGIATPRSILIRSAAELPTAYAELGFPFVVKPTISWTGKSDARLISALVVNEAEAVEAAEGALDAGADVLAQEWASGRREGVSLFIADGEVLAAVGHVAHRTSPPLGGVSILRESIEPPEDILAPAITLATEIGLEGSCEVEFRRDKAGRPLLMEINPRLAGTIENAVRSGVDFPLMIWRRATGLPVERVAGYRTGVRTRWLHGDLRWLRENHRLAGRPDTVSKGRGFWLFASEFARTRYYDNVDGRDLGPAVTELRVTAAAFRTRGSRHTPANTAS
jgi:predicted ATP-grasp superfamily ATP-dependent carboligase